MYNWDNNFLPNGEYYFYLTLFQNPDNIHKSTLVITDGQLEIKYVTPSNWGDLFELTTSYTTSVVINTVTDQIGCTIDQSSNTMDETNGSDSLTTTELELNTKFHLIQFVKNYIQRGGE